MNKINTYRFAKQHIHAFKQYLETQTDSHVVAKAIDEIEPLLSLQLPHQKYLEIREIMWKLFFKKFDDWLPF